MNLKCVICAFFVLAALLAVAGCTGTPSSQPGTTQPTAKTSPTITIAVKTTTPAVIPATGVYVHVNYLGGWTGTYGMPGALQKVTNSGERLYQIENVNGTVQASIAKEDKSAHELVVEIYNNGVLLKRGNTTAAFGNVTVSIDTGIRLTPTPTKTPATKITTATTTAAATKTTTK